MELPITIGFSSALRGIRCVLAIREIRARELIESCPLILIPAHQEGIVDKTIFGNYVYEWNQKYDCFVLGYCVMTNHSYTPNTLYKRDYRNKKMNYYAIKTIHKGEELVVNYNGDPNESEPVDPEYTDFTL